MRLTHLVLFKFFAGASNLPAPVITDVVPFTKGLAKKGALEGAMSLMGTME